MAKGILQFSLAVALLVLAVSAVDKPRSEKRSDHSKWITDSLIEMKTIKVGMTRRELLRVFSEEGGLSTRTRRTYVYHGCPYIKVDVELEPVGPPQSQILRDGPDDKIMKISRPYLEWSVMD